MLLLSLARPKKPEPLELQRIQPCLPVQSEWSQCQPGTKKLRATKQCANSEIVRNLRGKFDNQWTDLRYSVVVALVTVFGTGAEESDE